MAISRQLSILMDYGHCFPYKLFMRQETNPLEYGQIPSKFERVVQLIVGTTTVALVNFALGTAILSATSIRVAVIGALILDVLLVKAFWNKWRYVSFGILTYMALVVVVMMVGVTMWVAARMRML